MIDLRKNDLIDAVFDRYKESYKHALDTGKFIPQKEINKFHACLGRGLRRDIKKIDREFKKVKRREWRASARAWLKKLFKKLCPWLKEKPEPPAPAEPTATNEKGGYDDFPEIDDLCPIA